jgi:hypothetical protein
VELQQERRTPYCRYVIIVIIIISFIAGTSFIIRIKVMLAFISLNHHDNDDGVWLGDDDYYGFLGPQ